MTRGNWHLNLTLATVIPLAVIVLSFLGGVHWGLALAARDLHAAGYRVQVLEARDRIGGRTRVDHIDQTPVDVGGQWIGRGHERLRSLATRAGATIRPQYTDGDKLLQLSSDATGHVRRYAGLIPKVSWPALAELELAIRSLNRKARSIDPAAPWSRTSFPAYHRVTPCIL